MPVTQPHERREVHLAGNVLLPDVPVRILASGVSVVGNQRTVIIPGAVKIGGLLTIVYGQNEPAVQRKGNLAGPILDRQASPHPDTLRAATNPGW
jgi:hypothetical protein